MKQTAFLHSRPHYITILLPSTSSPWLGVDIWASWKSCFPVFSCDLRIIKKPLRAKYLIFKPGRTVSRYCLFCSFVQGKVWFSRPVLALWVFGVENHKKRSVVKDHKPHKSEHLQLLCRGSGCLNSIILKALLRCGDSVGETCDFWSQTSQILNPSSVTF